MKKIWLIVCGVVLEALLLLASADAAYTFTNIADTTGQFFSFGAPAINANGSVTFRAELDTFHTGIFLGDGGGVTTVAHNNGSSFQGFAFQTPGIDSAGTVFFAANRTGAAGGGNGIFHGDGESTGTYALNMSPVGVTTFGRPAVSPGGELAFRGSHVEVPAGPGRTGVFHELTLLASSSGEFADFGNGNAEIAVNDGGMVVFTGMLDSGVSGVYVSGGAGGVAIADSTGQFSNFVHSSPSINNEGTVAFHASSDAGGDGIFLGTAGEAAAPLVTSGGTFTSFAQVASINSAGTVAFSGFSTSGSGLFVGPSFVSDRVLLAGDALFGSTITAHAISNASLNDAGQLAFRYTLANGVNGIAIATPTEEFLPGDFDLDGDVDGRDFLTWQRNPAIGDLADWQTNYGLGMLGALSVPEPGSLVILMGMTALIRRTSRRCQ